MLRAALSASSAAGMRSWSSKWSHKASRTGNLAGPALELAQSGVDRALASPLTRVRRSPSALSVSAPREQKQAWRPLALRRRGQTPVQEQTAERLQHVRGKSARPPAYQFRARLPGILGSEASKASQGPFFR